MRTFLWIFELMQELLLHMRSVYAWASLRSTLASCHRLVIIYIEHIKRQAMICINN